MRTVRGMFVAAAVIPGSHVSLLQVSFLHAHTVQKAPDAAAHGSINAPKAAWPEPAATMDTGLLVATFTSVRME